MIVQQQRQLELQPRNNKGYIRAGLWGLGCGWFALSRAEQMTAGVANRGCSSQHP